MKPPQPALEKALVTEFVVGAVGSLIGAPVCDVQPVEISGQLLPWEFQPGQPLIAGIGSATVNLAGTITEIRPNLTRRYDDDNRRRQAAVYALVDWCYGSDLQWLLQVDAEWKLHSHDHGWYLPPAGPSWSMDSLRAHVNVPCTVSDDPAGLDATEIARLADALDSFPEAGVLEVLRSVPSAWPASDEELGCLGWFLQERAPQVARRLRSL